MFVPCQEHPTIKNCDSAAGIPFSVQNVLEVHLIDCPSCSFGTLDQIGELFQCADCFKQFEMPELIKKHAIADIPLYHRQSASSVFKPQSAEPCKPVIRVYTDIQPHPEPEWKPRAVHPKLKNCGDPIAYKDLWINQYYITHWCIKRHPKEHHHIPVINGYAISILNSGGFILTRARSFPPGPNTECWCF